MRSLAKVQVFTAVILMVGFFVLALFAPAYLVAWAEVLLALGIAHCYAWLGLVLVRYTRGGLKMLVLRHMFRVLIVGALLVVLPLLLFDRISPVTIGGFMLIHWIGWWWVFGRKNASCRYVLAQ